jgi:hypothetical protein
MQFTLLHFGFEKESVTCFLYYEVNVCGEAEFVYTHRRVSICLILDSIETTIRCMWVAPWCKSGQKKKNHLWKFLLTWEIGVRLPELFSCPAPCPYPSGFTPHLVWLTKEYWKSGPYYRVLLQFCINISEKHIFSSLFFTICVFPCVFFLVTLLSWLDDCCLIVIQTCVHSGR